MTASLPCYCYANPKTEREMHRTLAGFLRVSLPKLWLFNHQPNEGSRGWKAQRDLADFGVIAGWPDIQILGPGCIAYFLELKTEKGTVQLNQKEIGEKIGALGGNFAVARSYREAETILLSWGIPLTVTFDTYLSAWTSKSTLSLEDYNTLILGALPQKPDKYRVPKISTKKPKVPNGTLSAAPKAGKRRAA